jgi:uncharacterized DUF497 family protein
VLQKFIMDIEITFDDVKRASNKAKHGLDFADLTVAFFDAATIFDAKDERLMAVGWLGDRVVTVIFRPLGTEAVSVVSMRRASRKERRQFE